jgi:hypothetical protein
MAQPHKGERKQIAHTRVPTPVYDLVSAEAERLGVPRSEVLLHAVCLTYGMPEHDPLAGRLDEDEDAMPMTA